MDLDHINELRADTITAIYITLANEDVEADEVAWFISVLPCKMRITLQYPFSGIRFERSIEDNEDFTEAVCRHTTTFCRALKQTHGYKLAHSNV